MAVFLEVWHGVGSDGIDLFLGFSSFLLPSLLPSIHLLTLILSFITLEFAPFQTGDDPPRFFMDNKRGWLEAGICSDGIDCFLGFPSLLLLSLLPSIHLLLIFSFIILEFAPFQPGDDPPGFFTDDRPGRILFKVLVKTVEPLLFQTRVFPNYFPLSIT